MKKYEDWTYEGTWATFDAFFFLSPRVVQVSELKERVRHELTQKEGAWKSAGPLNRLVHPNVALVNSKTMSSAQKKLRKLIKTNCHYISSEYHLFGERLDSVTAYLGEDRITIKDIKGINSSQVSDDLMFLAERISLPIPYNVEKRWIEQMVSYANKDRGQITELAKRDGNDLKWQEETWIHGLQVAGYIPHLSQLPEFFYLKDVSPIPPKVKGYKPRAA